MGFDCRCDEPLAPDGESVGVDELLTALAHPRRRFVLYCLLERDSASVTELSDAVAGWEHADVTVPTTDEARDRVRTLLVHQHLPVLAESGLVAYDAERGTVALAPHEEVVDDLVQWAYEREESHLAG